MNRHKPRLQLTKTSFRSERSSYLSELVDVCGRDPVSLQAAVSETGATGHTSRDAMLATTTTDAVIVTTPSGLHPNQTIAIARSGRHVVSEKPMAKIGRAHV